MHNKGKVDSSKDGIFVCNDSEAIGGGVQGG